MTGCLVLGPPTGYKQVIILDDVFDKLAGRRAPSLGCLSCDLSHMEEGSGRIPDSGHQPVSGEECYRRESEADDGGWRDTDG